MVKITIKDDYTLELPNGNILGRQWEDNAEKIIIDIPNTESTSQCTMLIEDINHVVIDHIVVVNNEVLIEYDLSSNKSIFIGFTFVRTNDSQKNTDYELFTFDKALNPNSTVPITPEQKTDIETLRANAFADVVFKENQTNTLQFKNIKGVVKKELNLSPFVQEQSDWAETDNTKESYIKNKPNIPTSTNDLTNNGDSNPTISGDTSKYATENYVAANGGKIDKIQVNGVEQTITNKTVNLSVPEVIDNLNSTSTSNALSANQGKVLREQIAGKTFGTSFSNIQTMVSNLNSATNADYKVAFNLYIVATEVPDFWVTNVENSSVQYTYTSDTDLINAVKLAPVQIGYYKISLLETEKVDLSDYQEKIQFSTMPNASSSNLGDIVEYIGETNNNYTNGYFYKCVDTSVQESITATQTDNVVSLGTITVDNATFKSKVSAGTHEFVFKGYNTVLNFTNINVFPPVSIQVTRDNTFDRQIMLPNSPRFYSWVDGSNNFYITDTLQPNALTKLYLLDINTQEGTDTGATFISSNTPSLLEGRWTKKEGDVYTDVDINEYGIYLTSAGLPGNTISVTYVEANTSYSWQQKDVQPSGSGNVQSVNGQTGAVVLDADDISDTNTTNKFITESEKAKINVINTNGDGNSYLSNNGTYKTIQSAPAIDNSSITQNASLQLQAVGVVEQNVGTTIKEWYGTKAQYNAVLPKDPNTIYYITDDVVLKGYWTGTQAQYDALGTYDPDVFYVITDYQNYVTVTLATVQTTSGTFSASELAKLQGDETCQIKTVYTSGRTSHEEYFKLETNAADDGTMQYSHEENKNGTLKTKFITITTTTGSWVMTSPSAGMSNPMTTQGDIIYGGSNGTPTRLAKGTNGQVLQSTENGVQWATPSAGGVQWTSTLSSDLTKLRMIKMSVTIRANDYSYGANGTTYWTPPVGFGSTTPSIYDEEIPCFCDYARGDASNTMNAQCQFSWHEYSSGPNLYVPAIVKFYPSIQYIGSSNFSVSVEYTYLVEV